MRIVWNSEAAQSARSLIERVLSQVEAVLGRSHSVQKALAKADPNGDNQRLNAITDEFEIILRRLKQAEMELEKLSVGTRYMINTFEDVERQTIAIMDALDTGAATFAFENAAYNLYDQEVHDTAFGMGSLRPSKPVIGPHFGIGPIAPMPEWLADSMAENYFR